MGFKRISQLCRWSSQNWHNDNFRPHAHLPRYTNCGALHNIFWKPSQTSDVESIPKFTLNLSRGHAYGTSTPKVRLCDFQPHRSCKCSLRRSETNTMYRAIPGPLRIYNPDSNQMTIYYTYIHRPATHRTFLGQFSQVSDDQSIQLIPAHEVDGMPPLQRLVPAEDTI